MNQIDETSTTRIIDIRRKIKDIFVEIIENEYGTFNKGYTSYEPDGSVTTEEIKERLKKEVSERICDDGDFKIRNKTVNINVDQYIYVFPNPEKNEVVFRT